MFKFVVGCLNGVSEIVTTDRNPKDNLPLKFKYHSPNRGIISTVFHKLSKYGAVYYKEVEDEK